MEHPGRPARGDGAGVPTAQPLAEPDGHRRRPRTSPVPVSARSLTADRNRWSKDPPITSFRHELCEQIQRLGGVVTVPEFIDLTILLRPAADTRRNRSSSSGWRRRWRGRRWRRRARWRAPVPASAGGRQGGRRLLAGTGRLRREARAGRRRAGGVRPAAAAAAGLPGALRGRPAAAAARLPALQQRTAAESGGGDEQDRRRLVPAGTLPPWHGGGTGLAAGPRGVGGAGPGRGRGGLHGRADPGPAESRYPEAEPLPDRPELDALLHRVGLDVRWDAEKKIYHRREARSSPRRARRSRVGGPRRPRPAQSR